MVSFENTICAIELCINYKPANQKPQMTKPKLSKLIMMTIDWICLLDGKLIHLIGDKVNIF